MSDLAEAVIEIGRLALVLGATNRTACWHPDGQQRESVADHTVMIGWVAPALAAKFYPGTLDAALVAEYALIHDMPEVHVGDTPTLRIDDAGRAAKAERENWAVGQIVGTFAGSLPWVVFRLTEYERQVIPEARFVRATDKILPKIVHLLDGAKGLIEEGMTVSELRGVFDRQAEDMARYAGDFPELLALRAELVERTITLLAEHNYRTDLAAGRTDTTPEATHRTPIGTDIDLLCYAAEAAIRSGYASLKLVQRRARVGFAKAQRLLQLLEEYGITGPKPPGSVKRPALVPESGRRAALAALRDAAAKENADA